MSDRSGNKIAWKRPISRIYPYNLEVGENYYIPMTTYLDNKVALETPGALTFRQVEYQIIHNIKMLFYKRYVNFYRQFAIAWQLLIQFYEIKEIRKTDTSNDLVGSITLLTTIYLALTRQFQGLIKYLVDSFADVNIFVAYLSMSMTSFLFSMVLFKILVKVKLSLDL